jgi:integrase
MLRPGWVSPGESTPPPRSVSPCENAISPASTGWQVPSESVGEGVSGVLPIPTCAASFRCSCCEQFLTERSVQDVLGVLRSALSNTVTEELVSKNVATTLRLPSPRKKRVKPWSADEASRFLEATREAGLTWDLVDFKTGELSVGEQHQRVRRQLLRRQVKTASSKAGLPIPASQRSRHARSSKTRTGNSTATGGKKTDWCSRPGTAPQSNPETSTGASTAGSIKLGLRRITVHGTRKTCGTLLAALDVHPRVAMQILRHSQIAVTMEIYTETTSEATRDALSKLGTKDRGQTKRTDGRLPLTTAR